METNLKMAPLHEGIDGNTYVSHFISTSEFSTQCHQWNAMYTVQQLSQDPAKEHPWKYNI